MDALFVKVRQRAADGLLKIVAWDEANYDEVLRLAKEGVAHDTEWAGLVSEWRKWEYQVYCHIGDKDNTPQLARHFFFNGGRWGD